MKMSPDIDLSPSLRKVFGNKGDFTQQIAQGSARQSETANAILRRFFATQERERRELMILADEVGLGKTYVGLTVAVSMLDAIRRGESPDGLPANKPVVLVLTPTNDALFNKWMREAEAFKTNPCCSLQSKVCSVQPSMIETCGGNEDWPQSFATFTLQRTSADSGAERARCSTNMAFLN